MLQAVRAARALFIEFLSHLAIDRQDVAPVRISFQPISS